MGEQSKDVRIQRLAAMMSRMLHATLWSAWNTWHSAVRNARVLRRCIGPSLRSRGCAFAVARVLLPVIVLPYAARRHDLAHGLLSQRLCRLLTLPQAASTT